MIFLNENAIFQMKTNPMKSVDDLKTRNIN